MEYPPPPPQIHYHYQVPPPPDPPQRKIWRWVVLGLVSGVLLCLCSTMVVSCENAQRQRAIYASVPSLTDIENEDATATADARARLYIDDGAPSNPWNYNYEPEANHYVYNDPPTFCRYFKCATPFGSTTDGFVVECNDGLYTHDGGKNTACTGHGGVKHALYWH